MLRVCAMIDENQLKSIQRRVQAFANHGLHASCCEPLQGLILKRVGEREEGKEGSGPTLVTLFFQPL